MNNDSFTPNVDKDTTNVVQVSREFEWKVFDLLPKYVREIIANGECDVSVTSVAKQYMRMRHLSKQTICYELRRSIRMAAKDQSQ